MGARVPWHETQNELLVRVIDRQRRIEVLRSELEATCAECGRPIGFDGRWYSDGGGELVPYCASCAQTELPVI